MVPAATFGKTALESNIGPTIKMKKKVKLTQNREESMAKEQHITVNKFSPGFNR